MESLANTTCGLSEADLDSVMAYRVRAWLSRKHRHAFAELWNAVQEPKPQPSAIRRWALSQLRRRAHQVERAQQQRERQRRRQRAPKPVYRVSVLG